MPKLNGKGPEGKGAGSGRKLGRCFTNNQETLLDKLGKGMGMRRRVACGEGKGKRINSGKE